MEQIKLLIEEAGAKVDLSSNEVAKEEEEENYDSLEEKYFMEAFRNAMTPLQVACVLGNEDIAFYLIE